MFGSLYIMKPIILKLTHEIVSKGSRTTARPGINLRSELPEADDRSISVGLALLVYFGTIVSNT